MRHGCGPGTASGRQRPLYSHCISSHFQSAEKVCLRPCCRWRRSPSPARPRPATGYAGRGGASRSVLLGPSTLVGARPGGGAWPARVPFCSVPAASGSGGGPGGPAGVPRRLPGGAVADGGLPRSPARARALTRGSLSHVLLASAPRFACPRAWASSARGGPPVRRSRPRLPTLGGRRPRDRAARPRAPQRRSTASGFGGGPGGPAVVLRPSWAQVSRRQAASLCRHALARRHVARRSPSGASHRRGRAPLCTWSTLTPLVRRPRGCLSSSRRMF